MKKILLAALCVAMAVPAFARDHELNGYFRVRGIMADLSKQKNADPDTLVDQRFRAKYTLGLNEYLKLVYFGEVDMQWGDNSYATSRNQGGALGGDTVNLETKNLYLEVKVPETPISATLGLQGYGDNYDAVLFSADMAGLKLGAKFGPADVTLGWFKWQEGEGNNNSPGGSTEEDDIDLYALNLGFKPMDALKVGADVYYINANGASNFTANTTGAAGLSLPESADLYYMGVNADYKAAMFGVKGWFLYGAGTVKTEPEMDLAGWAASVKGTGKVGPVSLGLRLAYFSGDDDATDSDLEYLATPTVSESFSFYDENLMLMVNDAFWNTYGQYGFAMTDAAFDGYGLWFAALSGSFSPPALKNMYVKAGVGYFAATEDDQTPGDNATDREGKTIGTEVALRVGYKMAEALDLSINGAYAFLGDFYDKTATDLDNGATGEDPDNPYEVYLMANLSY